MTKKEFKVGEVFQCGLVKLKVIEDKNQLDCSDCDRCFFADCCDVSGLHISEHIASSCIASERIDGKNVSFVKVED